MEIRYKVWDTINNCWFAPVYEFSQGRLHDVSLNMQGKVIERTMKSDASMRDNHGLIPLLCLGVNDADGNELYDECIIREVGTEETLRVWFDKGAFLVGGLNKEWDNYLTKIDASKFRIIGNIYDKY